MAASTSSAEPKALIRYADGAERIDAQLAVESTRLAFVLQDFISTCTEYRAGVDLRLAFELRLHAQGAAKQDAWVRRVAAGFQQADSGSFSPVGPTAGLLFNVYKDRNAWRGFFGGVRFVRGADGYWRVYGPLAAKQAMGLPPRLTRLGPKAIQRNIDQFSSWAAFKRLVARDGLFNMQARDLARTLTERPPLTPAVPFKMRVKGSAVISALTDIGMNIYDYGWGAHKGDGLTSRKFVVSTVADTSAGLGIVGVSTAIGTAIPIPGVGTAVGFAVGVGLQYAYTRWGKEAWRDAVDWAGRRLQDGYEAASRLAGDVKDTVVDAAHTVKETVEDAAGVVQDKLGDAVDGAKDVASALNPFD